jgi:hypothetical protein
MRFYTQGTKKNPRGFFFVLKLLHYRWLIITIFAAWIAWRTAVLIV